MKEYAKRKIIEQTGTINAEAFEVSGDIFKTQNSNTKDLKLYEEDENLLYVKQLEESYVTRKFSKAEKRRIDAAGRDGKEEEKEKIRQERREQFKHIMLVQAQKSNSTPAADTQSGNLEKFASKLMLSLNYLSQQEFYQQMGLTSKLQNTAAMLGDIIRFGDKKLEREEDFFKATLYTITTMFGYVKKNLEELKSQVNVIMGNLDSSILSEMDAEKKEVLKAEIAYKDETLKTFADLTSDAESIGGLIVRLESRALDISKKLGQEGRKSVKWHDLFESTFISETITPQSQVDDSGAGTSVVYKLMHGREQVYFKGDEKVGDPVELMFKSFNKFDSDIGLQILDVLRKNEPAAKEMTSCFASIWHQNNMANRTHDQAKANKILAQADDTAKSVSDYLRREGIIVDSKDIFQIALSNGKNANAIAVAQVNAKLETGDDMTLRNYATEHLAFLFDAEDVVVKSQDAVLKSGNKETQGFIMEEAAGKTLLSVMNMFERLKKQYPAWDDDDPGPQFLLTKKAVDQIITLRFMDAVSGQADRHASNIMVDYVYDRSDKSITITSVKGIDHDMSFGKVDNLYNVLKDDGTYEFDFDYCPRSLYESVMTITPELLRQNMANYIEPKYMDKMVQRFETLKSALIAKRKKMEDQAKTSPATAKDLLDNISYVTDATKFRFLNLRR